MPCCIVSPMPGLTSRSRDAAIVGLIGAFVSYLGSWIPSPWWDEVATMAAVHRSPSEFIELISRVDLAHATYYAILDVWIHVFPDSIASMRILSSIMIGLAAAGLVVLGNQLGSRRLGWLAGIAFILLPRATLLGMDARSGALAVALAVWLTVVFVSAVRDGRARWWLLYVAFQVVLTHVFLYGITLMAGHGLVLVVLHRHHLRRLLPWITSAAVVLVLCSPFIYFLRLQQGVLGGLAPISLDTIREVFVEQWLIGNLPLAILFWATIVVAAIVVAVRRGRNDIPPYTFSIGAVEIALPALILPTLAIVLYTIFVGLLYAPRYFAFSTFAAALLFAWAADRLGGRIVSWVLIGALLLLSLPTYLEQRDPGKYPNDWTATCEALGDDLEPGDTVLFSAAATPWDWVELIPVVCPHEFVGVNDPSVIAPAIDADTLFPPRVGPTDTNLTGAERVWLVADNSVVTQDTSVFDFLVKSGFRRESVQEGQDTSVYEYVR